MMAAIAASKEAFITFTLHTEQRVCLPSAAAGHGTAAGTVADCRLQPAVQVVLDRRQCEEHERRILAVHGVPAVCSNGLLEREECDCSACHKPIEKCTCSD